MNILVISASMRAESQSLKVSNWLSSHAITLGMSSSVLDLHQFKLPMFDAGETVAENKLELLEMLEAADAYVFVSPEWDGMMSHGLISMLHYTKKEMAYKPVMLVGVSSGRGGTHPIDQMKLMGQKNKHYILSPENLLVGGAEDVLNSPDIDRQAPDFAIKERADYSLRVLGELASALASVRNSETLDFKRFGNGV